MFLSLLRLIVRLGRLGFIVGILGIVGGLVFIIAVQVSGVPEALAPLVGCEEVKENNFSSRLTCVTENGEKESDLNSTLEPFGLTILFGSVMLMVVGLLGGMMAYSIKLGRIVATGEPAQAVILGMQETGTRVNNQPMIKFRLRVQPQDGQPPYEATTNRVISYMTIGSLGVGMTIPVKYDPNHPQDVAVDFNAMRSTPISINNIGAMLSAAPQEEKSLADKLQELEESYKLGLINQQEYEKARQKVLNEI